jgi:hypothetical protein
VNGVDAKSIFCLAEALTINQSLKDLLLESNPLGKLGVALLMKAETKNMENSFTINIKNADSESAADSRHPIFDRTIPEGTYSLDLTKTYD